MGDLACRRVRQIAQCGAPESPYPLNKGSNNVLYTYAYVDATQASLAIAHGCTHCVRMLGQASTDVQAYGEVEAQSDKYAYMSNA